MVYKSLILISGLLLKITIIKIFVVNSTNIIVC